MTVAPLPSSWWPPPHAGPAGWDPTPRLPPIPLARAPRRVGRENPPTGPPGAGRSASVGGRAGLARSRPPRPPVVETRPRPPSRPRGRAVAAACPTRPLSAAVAHLSRRGPLVGGYVWAASGLPAEQGTRGGRPATLAYCTVFSSGGGGWGFRGGGGCSPQLSTRDTTRRGALCRSPSPIRCTRPQVSRVRAASTKARVGRSASCKGRPRPGGTGRQAGGLCLSTRRKALPSSSAPAAFRPSTPPALDGRAAPAGTAGGRIAGCGPLNRPRLAGSAANGRSRSQGRALCRGYTAYLAARAYETLGTVDAATTLPHGLSEGGGGGAGWGALTVAAATPFPTKRAHRRERPRHPGTRPPHQHRWTMKSIWKYHPCRARVLWGGSRPGPASRIGPPPPQPPAAVGGRGPPETPTPPPGRCL